MKLVPRLTLLFMVCIAVLLSGRGLLRVRHQSAAFENDMLRDHRFIGRALAADLAETWRAEGEQRARHLVDIASRTTGPGINLSWLTQAQTGGATRPGDLAAALRGNEVQHFGTDALRSYFPVRAGDFGGVLLVSESLAERDRYVQTSVVHASTSLALVLFCCGVFAMLLSRWLVAMPVRRLIDKAQRVAGGDFSKPLNLPRNDEFQSLAIEMNAMCEALAEAKADFAAEAQARQRTTEQLRHAERLSTVGKLAAGIAHELGTPLSIVSGHAEMIVNREVHGDKVIESANVIVREAQRIARIVRSLLGFARRKGPEGEPCDVAETVQRCITLLRPMAEKANLEFSLESARDCRVHRSG